jgi:phage protein D
MRPQKSTISYALPQLQEHSLMQPAYTVTVSGSDITGKIRDRLISLRVTDEAGSSADAVEIVLDNRKDAIAAPRTGVQLEVAMGYQGTGLSDMGLYTVDEIIVSGSVNAGKTLTIRAKAADMLASLKERKTRAWDNGTLSDIVGTIAGEHKLTPRVEAVLSAIQFTHLDQTNESDLHFLSRLARHYDAIAKPANGFLLFVPRGEAKTASGKNLPTIALTAGDLNSWRARAAERGKYKAVIANWKNAGTGKREPIKAGAGTPVFTLRRTYADATTALNAAQARLDALTRGAATLDITLAGRADMAAESPLSLSGAGDIADGNWTITQAEHTISKAGFITRVSAETPKKGAF